MPRSVSELFDCENDTRVSFKLPSSSTILLQSKPLNSLWFYKKMAYLSNLSYSIWLCVATSVITVLRSFRCSFVTFARSVAVFVVGVVFNFRYQRVIRASLCLARLTCGMGVLCELP